MDTNETRRALRAEMPVVDRWAYFDHAAVSPLPRPTSARIAAWLQQASEQGVAAWASWSQDVEQTRAAAAKLLNAASGEIALVPNTTTGINLVAEGFPWQSGDNVVTLADEFPSNLYPWMYLQDRGVETRRVATTDGQLDISHVRAACDSRTRIVSVSWVGYSTGYRNDLVALAEMAHECDALLFVDGIQGVGAFPLDVQQVPVDFLAADGHKWQLGPEGAGIAFIRHCHLDLLRPTSLGWNSVVHSNDFTKIALDLKPHAGRFEGGTQNMSGLLGLGASLRLLLQLDMDRVAAAILEFTDQLADVLPSVGARVVSHRTDQHRSGILSFDLPGRQLDRVRRHCLQEGVVLSKRAGWLRVSAHAYNDRQDLERLVAALKSAPVT